MSHIAVGIRSMRFVAGLLLFLVVLSSAPPDAAALDCDNPKGINQILKCMVPQPESCEPRSSPGIQGAWDQGEPFTAGHDAGSSTEITATGSGSGETQSTTVQSGGAFRYTFKGDNEGGINSRLEKLSRGRGGPYLGGPLIFMETYRETSASSQTTTGAGGWTGRDTERISIKTETRRPGEGTKISPTGKTIEVTGPDGGLTPLEGVMAALSDAGAVLGATIKSEMIDCLRSTGETDTESMTNTLDVDILVAIAGFTVKEIKKTANGWEATVEVIEGQVEE